MAKINYKFLKEIIKVKKLEKVASLSPGFHAETIGTVTIPDGYTYFGIMTKDSTKGNTYPIFNYNNSNNQVTAYVQVTSSNTTFTYSCNVVFVKTEFLNQILTN